LLGTMGGAVSVALLNSFLTLDQLHTWGWRIPFLLSAPMGVVALMVRHRLEETTNFVRMENQSKVEKIPTLTLLRDYPKAVLAVVCIACCAMAGYYIPFTYFVTYFQTQQIMSAQMAGLSATLSMLVAAAVIYPFGKLSDRIGRKPVLIGATLGFIVLSYPLFMLMQTSATAAMLAQITLGILEAAYLSTNYTLYSELLPTKVRTSGINIGISIAAIVAGGSAPYIATWLLATTGSPTSPAWILIGGAGISLVALLGIKETAGTALRTE